MNKIFSLFLLFLLPVMGFAQNQKEYDTPKYWERMKYFEENPIEAGSIVFVGNSLTEGGRWNEYFPYLSIFNRGIVGDNAEGILNRLDEIIAAKPQLVFILVGVNDISQNFSNEQILANYKSILRRLKQESPQTVIYVQSTLPINNDFGRYKRLTGKEQQVRSYNRQLEELCEKENVDFLNIYPLFEDNEGKLKKEITNDGLHLNEAGYEIWVNALKEKIPAIFE